MKKLIAVLTLGLLATSAAADENWYADFDEAVKVAQEQKKDLLVDFTGSDWCGWCVRLHEEVFSHDEFLTPAQEQYVLVALDFPNSAEAKAKVPNPERNQELSQKYGIEGFPTILLMTVEGEVFAQTGYRAGGPEAYIEHLNEIATAGRKELEAVKKLVAEFEAAKGGAKHAVWEKALTQITELKDGSPFAAQLAPVVRWGIEADPKNEKGYKLKSLEALLKSGQANEEELEAAGDLDPKNEKGLLEIVVEAKFTQVTNEATAWEAVDALDELIAFGFKDKEVGFMLLFTAARWTAGPLQDMDAAKKYAKLAKELGTENEEMIGVLDEIIGS